MLGMVAGWTDNRNGILYIPPHNCQAGFNCSAHRQERCVEGQIIEINGIILLFQGDQLMVVHF